MGPVYNFMRISKLREQKEKNRRNKMQSILWSQNWKVVLFIDAR